MANFHSKSDKTKKQKFLNNNDGIVSQHLINTHTMQQKAKHQASLFGDAIIQPKANDTGLPDNLKSGIESLSGVDMSDVKVHYNSSKPAQLNAFAFAQGSDIHLASGQEKHLPHEAWHVVQQKQGRVKPTKQLKSNTSINDDPQLEREATIMGNKALHTDSSKSIQTKSVSHKISFGSIIQGWWPKGHRLVTTLAFQKGNFIESYDKKARDYLITRSPDIDFIQDVFDTMNEGIKQTKPYFKIYQKYIESGQLEQAKAMYENGELNKRRPSYLLMHGEAGAYKDKNASPKNISVTNMFVNKAISKWNKGDKEQALSILSDALHQAADRGSHGEGNPFSGHDTRIQLGVKGKGDIPGIGKQKWKQQSWETPLGGKLGGKKWEPDNISSNSRGAALAVAFVIAALKKFLNGVGEKVIFDTKVTKGQRKLEANIPLTEKLADMLPERLSDMVTETLPSVNLILPPATSKDKSSKLIGKTGDGKFKKGINTLRKIYENEEKNDNGQLEYSRERELGIYKNVPKGFEENLEKGEKFYDTALSKSDIKKDILQYLMTIKHYYGSDNLANRYVAIIDYYKLQMNNSANDKILVDKYFKEVHKTVFGYEFIRDYTGRQPTKADKRVEIYNKAKKTFQEFKKSRFRRGGLKKSERRKRAKEYYYELVKDKEDEEKKLYDSTIKAAYYYVFKEKLKI